MKKSFEDLNKGERELGRLLQQIIASGVRRWHTEAALCIQTQSIAAHQYNTVLICLAIWPESHIRSELLLALLTHDLGEYLAGDMPATAKWLSTPKELFHVDEVELIGIERLDVPMWSRTLTPCERQYLKAADHIDLWMYALLEWSRGNSHAQYWIERIRKHSEPYRNLNDKTERLFTAMENAASQGQEGVLRAIKAFGFWKPPPAVELERDVQNDVGG